MDAAAEEYFGAAVADGSYRGFLAANEAGEVIGGGGIVISPWGPVGSAQLTEEIHDYNVHVDSNDVFWMIAVRHDAVAEDFDDARTRLLVRNLDVFADDDSRHWYRSYGNENWEFNQDGLMAARFACINDLPILESDRKFHWPLGRRPDDHAGLSDLGL